MSIKKFFGDKAFYKSVLAVAFPIMVQNGVTTFVNMLDNLMVGSVGTEAMSGVSVVNQFLFIFNLLIFGASSAAGIFMAQYAGNKDVEGERYTFRFKFVTCVLVTIISIGVLFAFNEGLIGWFLQGEENGGDIELTFAMGKSYLFVMLIGLLPFAVSNVYASSMRETGDTITPMIASIISVATNFILNSVLIFGLLGCPALGVTGAAIATVIARFFELAVLVIKTHVKKEKYQYAVGAYRSFKIPAGLFKDIMLRGLPLMINEMFWSIAVTVANQSYSTRGLNVVAALNIYSTLWNVFSIVFISMGNAIAIVVGNLLGAGKLDEAKDTDRKMIALSVMLAVGMAIILASLSPVFPLLYNTTDDIRALATYLILIASTIMPFSAFNNASYFTIRAGGQVLLTVIFDSGFMWAVSVPVLFCLSRFTVIDIYLLFVIGQSMEILKFVFGFILIKKNNWVRRLVDDK